jgi:hypothetical protein
MFTKLKNLHTHTDFIFNDILANPYHKASRIENQTDHRLPFSNIRMPFLSLPLQQPPTMVVHKVWLSSVETDYFLQRQVRY